MYKVQLTWNGKTVLDGTATAVCASDIVANYFRDNFAGVDFRRWAHVNLEPPHSPGFLLGKLKRREVVRLEWRDETGHATAEVTSDALALGYRINHNRVGDVWSFDAPDGTEDEREFATEAEAVAAAQAHAREGE